MPNKIVIHWTGGAYTPNQKELNSYHFLVAGDGNVFSGKYTPRDNDCCTDGKYAAHTGGGNTGAIGVAYCGMLGYKSPSNVGKYPITPKQTEALFELCSELSKQYNIPVPCIMTHYEFGKANPKTTSAGKIDVTYLPAYPNITADEMGEFIRNKIKWYKNRKSNG